jgi:hypothetical protein
MTDKENMTETMDVSNINFEKKITIRNLADWNVGFVKNDTTGDITIAPHGTTRISRAEVISQVENSNKLFIGTGDGNHATIYIDDEVTRKYVEFDNQQILTKECVSKLFKITSLAKFKSELKNVVVTRAEKFALMKFIKDLRLNDYDKIKACEEHCGVTLS